MRTTVNLDDVAAAVDELRRNRRLGLSEALNLLARQGILREQATHRYDHRTVALGLRVDVSNIGHVLDVLDDAA